MMWVVFNKGRRDRSPVETEVTRDSVKLCHPRRLNISPTLSEGDQVTVSDDVVLPAYGWPSGIDMKTNPVGIPLPFLR